VSVGLYAFLVKSTLLLSLPTDLSGWGELQSRDAQQIVGGANHISGELRLDLSDEAGFSESTYGLHPAKDFLEALSRLLAHGIALTARGACIQPRRNVILDLSDVRRDVALPEQFDERFVVIALVGSERAHVLPRLPSEVQQRRGGAQFGQRGGGHGHVDQQAVAVFHERVRPVGEFRWLAVTFAHEFRLGIGTGFARGVTALLAPEIDHARAITTRARRLAVFSLEALERRPRLDQRAIDREVLIRQQPLGARLLDDASKERPRDIVLDQARPVYRERRVIKREALQIHVQEPAKQHVVVEHLAEQALGPHRIQRDQETALQQPLGGNRGSAAVGVHRLQHGTHRTEFGIGLCLDRPQRVIRRDAFFDREIAEQAALRINVTARSCSPVNGLSSRTGQHEGGSGCFSTTC